MGKYCIYRGFNVPKAPILINPLLLNSEPTTYQILLRFLLGAISRGEVIWSEEKTFNLSKESSINQTSSQDTFTLTHSLLLRPRNSPQKIGYRIEIFSLAKTPIGDGAFASVRESLGTIKLTTEEMHVASRETAPKKRVIKFFKPQSHSLSNGNMALRIKHLHAKPMVNLPSDAFSIGSKAQVMKHLTGISLQKLMNESSLHTNLTPLAKIKLARALLEAYESQIAGQNIIHCDLKPDNIMVHFMENQEPAMHFIDFDDAKILIHLDSQESIEVLSAATTPFSPLQDPVDAAEQLIPVLSLESSNVKRYLARSDRMEEHDGFQLPKGTLGYMPPEGFLAPPALNDKYDYYSLARVIAKIFHIPVKCYSGLALAYDEAKQHAMKTDYRNQIPENVIPDQFKSDIEHLLTQLSHIDPSSRPNLTDVLDFFKMIENQLEHQSIQPLCSL